MLQLLLLILLLSLMLWNLLSGELALPWVGILWDLVPLSPPQPELALSPSQHWVLYTLRLPRTLVAVGSGIALALAGTLTQGLTRNPLASPSTLGFTSAAALAALSLVILAPTAPLWLFPLAALGGAMAAVLLLTLLLPQANFSPLRLVLAGLGLGLGATAVVQILLTIGELRQVNQALFWVTGSVYGRTWAQVMLLWVGLGLGLPALWIQSRTLDVLALGEDLAQGLGVSLGTQRRWLLGWSVGLTAIAVATAGSVGFVGLMAPHLARQWVGTRHRLLLPVAGLIGGILVTGADGLGRCLFAPVEIPCGVITALLGGPYFLYLLVRSRPNR
ncbi:MAG: FecCD family ABC transporter permease [Prochlorothrix sp.]|nr:iron ABC transporter permease [Prochlorothrix sp.]